MVRIIAGLLKGRVLRVPAQAGVRPTKSVVREMLFHKLTRYCGVSHQHDRSLEGLRVLDAYAGSGALGLEAISRGAIHCTFMESHPKVVPVLQANIAAMGLGAAQTRLYATDVARPPRTERPMDLVLMDPPYLHQRGPQHVAEYYQRITQALEGLRQAGWLGPGTWIVLEMHALQELPPGILGAACQLQDSCHAGHTRLIVAQEMEPA